MTVITLRMKTTPGRHLNEEEEDEAVLKALIKDRDRRIGDLQARLLESEKVRRQLHNRIQELQGSVRVIARVRPFLPNEQSLGH
jgi:predicted RNase H-like nuclease (RuvC/YqgF family)